MTETIENSKMSLDDYGKAYKEFFFGDGESDARQAEVLAEAARGFIMENRARIFGSFEVLAEILAGIKEGLGGGCDEAEALEAFKKFAGKVNDMNAVLKKAAEENDWLREGLGCLSEAVQEK